MNRADTDALLVDYVLGVLGDDDRRALDEQLARDPALAANLLGVEEALAAVAWVQAPLPPPPSGRDRLIQAVRGEDTPKFVFTDQVARFFDLPAADARAVLHKAASPAAWERSPVPGLHRLHLKAGPRYAGSDAMLLRFDGGANCPMHHHTGDEYSMILEGGVTLDDGRVLRAGDDLHMLPGTQHTFTVLPEGTLCGLITARAPR